jgi:VIT1/CCC1 family predicted Fe2+/Mn2+ transporter
MATGDADRYLANWQDEIDSAALYRTLAAAEARPELAEVYRRLAATEEQHSAYWEERLRASGVPVPAPRPGWRSRALGQLARVLGPQFILPTLVGMERIDSHGYTGQPETAGTTLPGEERSHARVLRALSGTGGGGLAGSAIGQAEGRHRAASGNALRAAVLGANDGLLSNFSLVMGVAGASLEGRAVLVAGLAGLLAGAGSMALGEWISVQSSRELYERQIAIEARELDEFPEEEVEELALIYQAKGLPESEARALAGRLMADRASALDALAREELGVDPAELGGSAWVAAATSFVLFAVGAIVPVAPFLLLSGLPAVFASVLVSTIALFLIGAAITLLTGRSVFVSGMRQVVFGLAAAALTWGVGRLIGVAIAG